MFPLVIAVFPWLVLLLVAYLLLTEPPKELDSTSWRSSFVFLIGRVFLRACVRRQGVLSPGWAVEGDKVKMDEDAKRNLSAVWRGWRLDPDVFARYCQACGISPPSNPGSASASDPFLYPETLFLRHMIAIITSTSFPFSSLGLIHLRQTVETHCTLSDLLAARCDLCCGVCDMRATDKGFEIDMKCDVHDVASGRILWSAVTTLLSRNKTTVEKQGKSSRAHEASQPFSGDIDSYTGKHLDVPDGTGLRYAAATGDYSPHHLYPRTARLLGYKQPMVHGMWTLAKVLAAIQAGTHPPLRLPLVMKATFKKPIFIPAKCTILYTRPTVNNEIKFEVRDTEGTILHVTGTIASN